jgi:hypothetical protein
MARKRDIYRFFDKGPKVVCPDCGEKTIFGSGSILGDISQSSHVEEDVLRRLYQDAVSGDFAQLCPECRYGEKRVILWMEMEPGRIRGPLCRRCFCKFLRLDFGGDREASEDIRVYYIQSTKATLRTLQELSIFFEEEDEGSEKPPIPPLDLF